MMSANRCCHSRLLLALAGLLGLSGCDTGVTGDQPFIAITNPTSAVAYETNSTGVRLGGTVAHASFVHVTNTTNGFGAEGFVNYVEGHGSWFADATGLAPGDNLIVATARTGDGGRTASDRIVVTRPLQPASLILNGADAASGTSYWVNAHSFGGSHRLALYSDGTGRSTTGSALTENAGPAVTMSWTYDGVEAIVISGCTNCSFQRIERISGATADGTFFGQIETVGGDSETSLHAFQLMAGSF